MISEAVNEADKVSAPLNAEVYCGEMERNPLEMGDDPITMILSEYLGVEIGTYEADIGASLDRVNGFHTPRLGYAPNRGASLPRIDIRRALLHYKFYQHEAPIPMD